MTNLLIVTLLVFSTISAIEISSKIDLDSDEQCRESSSVSTDPVIVVMKNEPDVPKETRGFPPTGSRSISGGNFHSRSPGNSVRTRNNYNPFPSQSRVIKNIHIVINGKDIVSSIPDGVDCKDNVCETTVTTNTEDGGNEIVSVSVRVHTRPKSIDVDDVPVIDGIRASGYENDGDWPTFVPNRGRIPSYPNFIDNNIPQRQLPRRNPLRPKAGSFYPRNFGPRVGSSAWNPWIPGKNPVDDKIEPPLSKTDQVIQ